MKLMRIYDQCFVLGVVTILVLSLKVVHACSDPFAADDFILKPAYAERSAEKERPQLSRVRLISVKCAHPVDTQESLKKQISPDLSLPHTKEGDKVFDVSSQFPNLTRDKDRLLDVESADLQWVYYNQTSGYYIAKADAFLEASIRNFVFSMLQDAPVNVQLSGTYIEVDEKVEHDLKAIAKHGYKLLYKFRFTTHSDDHVNIEDVPNSVSLQAYVDQPSDDLVGASLIFMSKNHGAWITFHIQLGKTSIFEVGASSEGKKKLFILTAECFDIDSEIIVRPSRRFNGVAKEVVNSKHAKDKGMKCIKYNVPLDFPKLFNRTYQKPTVAPSLAANLNGEDVWYDLTELIKEEGILTDSREWVLFNRRTAEVYCYLTKNGHELFVNLIECIRGGSQPSTLVTQASFYEVDATPANRQKKNWSFIDLMRLQPKQLARLGMVNCSGELSRVYDDPLFSFEEKPSTVDNGEIGLEISRSDIASEMDASWRFKIEIAGHRLVAKKSLTVSDGKSYIMSFPSTGKPDKLLLMVVTTNLILGYEDE